jgi:hypothetical protein
MDAFERAWLIGVSKNENEMEKCLTKTGLLPKN